MELKRNMFSTTCKKSFLAKRITVSPFKKIKPDLGIITSSPLSMAPTLISSGRFEFFNSLLINSDDSIISASIISYSPFNKL